MNVITDVFIDSFLCFFVAILAIIIFLTEETAIYPPPVYLWIFPAVFIIGGIARIVCRGFNKEVKPKYIEVEDNE